MRIPLVEVRVCTHSTCARQGSLELLAGLREYVGERGLGDIVKVGPCGCLGGCSYGPNVVVPPSPRVFLAMDLGKVKRLLTRLGLEGGPLREGEG